MAHGAILGQTPIIPDFPENPQTIATNVSYNNSSTSSIITGTNVQIAIDQLFTSVSNGKSLIASAITDKGISTAPNATFQTMANNIRSISELTGKQEILFGSLSAMATDIQHGVTFGYTVPTPTYPWAGMSIEIGEISGRGILPTVTLDYATSTTIKISMSFGSFGGTGTYTFELESGGTKISCYVTKTNGNTTNTSRSVILKFYGTYK